MKFFGKALAQRQPGVVTLQARSGELADALAKSTISPTFVCGYVSPHTDIDAVARTIGQRFPGVPTQLCSTAGELCNTGGELYCRYRGQLGPRRAAVLRCFSDRQGGTGRRRRWAAKTCAAAAATANCPDAPGAIDATHTQHPARHEHRPPRHARPDRLRWALRVRVVLHGGALRFRSAFRACSSAVRPAASSIFATPGCTTASEGWKTTR